jgi:hypothetical protein
MFKKTLIEWNSADPQKILRMRIPRKFWRWRSSENTEGEDPQKILRMRILRICCGWRSSENSEVTIFRKCWGFSENTEDEDPQKILRMRILRKFWGWGSSGNSEDEDPSKIMSSSENAEESSGNSEDSLDFIDNHQKTLIMTIPIIIGYIRCSSNNPCKKKKCSRRIKSSTKHGPILYTDNTQCFTEFTVCFFPDHQSYIQFQTDHTIMIIIRYIWYANHQIYPVIVRMTTLGKIWFSKEKQSQSMPLFCIHTARAVLVFVLASFSLLKIIWCMSRKWYPSNVLMIRGYPINRMTLRNFWMYPPEILLIS